MIVDHTNGPYHYLLALDLNDNRYDYVTSLTVETDNMTNPIELVNETDKKIILEIVDTDTTLIVTHKVLDEYITQTFDLTNITFEE